MHSFERTATRVASLPVRPRELGLVRLARLLLLVLTAASIAYLAVLAVSPTVREGLPASLRWFGSPASPQTILIVVGLIIALCVLSYRSVGSGSSVPVTIVLGLTAVNCMLSFASYWDCHDAEHPMFVTPLMWTLQVIKGSSSSTIQLGGDRACPTPIPAALEVARLSALGVILFGVASVGVTLFRSQFDRFRARVARSVTAVVGVDDDSQSMIGAVGRTLEPGSQLVLITDNTDRACVSESRNDGARIIAADLDQPGTVDALPWWHKTNRLYLLDADPATNLDRMRDIGRRMSALAVDRRIPLIVRIDDPWHAAAWRAEQFGGSDTRWAADTVGKYEVTARRLLDQITADEHVARILVCGTSPLTLALCADHAQRQFERDFYTNRPDRLLPPSILVGEAAEEYRRDQEFRQRQLGLPVTEQRIDAVAEPVSMEVLLRLVGADDSTGVGREAVIFVDAQAGTSGRRDPTIATRLAVAGRARCWRSLMKPASRSSPTPLATSSAAATPVASWIGTAPAAVTAYTA